MALTASSHLRSEVDWMVGRMEIMGEVDITSWWICHIDRAAVAVEKDRIADPRNPAGTLPASAK